MLTYMQIHLYFVLPPILLLGAIYAPLIGRREVLKVLWLGLMATIWTTPWDNFILSHSGWSYPHGSIIGKIFYVPIEEHMFFVLQPILVIMLHCIVTHGRLIPFDVDVGLPQIGAAHAKHDDRKVDGRAELPEEGSPDISKLSNVNALRDGDEEGLRTVQTLPRRPLAASIWLLFTLIGLTLVLEAHDVIDISSISRAKWLLGRHAFYQGWILVWISPVIGFLTYLGARLTRPDKVALAVGTGYLWIVDTIALRSGSWAISTETTLGIELWRGLPLEEAIFFFLTSYLIILSASLISHLHVLLLLSPDLPPCPPSNPLPHIILLARVAFEPPLIDRRMLWALVEGEKTLRKGSKSFDVAKLAFGREMRLGLVVIYAWCRVTDNLIDEPYIETPPDHQGRLIDDSLNTARARTLAAIRKHLLEAYNSPSTSTNNTHDNNKDSDTGTDTDAGRKTYPAHLYHSTKLDRILDGIPHLTSSDRSAFHLFSSLIPRLVPIYPFQELCDGYETDLGFSPRHIPFKQATSVSLGASTLASQGTGQRPLDLTEQLPIRTTDDLMKYADDVAGSIAGAICYLAWSVLTSSSSTSRPLARPVDGYTFAQALHDKTGSSVMPEISDAALESRLSVIRAAREMGRALQLVNISRDVAKDALISRLYVPLSFFPSASSLLGVLYPSSFSRADTTVSPSLSYAPYTLRLLDVADRMREHSAGAIDRLPWTARAGIRAMVASYFEIAVAVRRQGGEVDGRGVKVSKKRRIRKAMGAIWLGGGATGQARK
ncbi:hypothetical protein IAU59_006073 [Kwoniella sp. CBS 9459]